jgi:hypothetical protein
MVLQNLTAARDTNYLFRSLGIPMHGENQYNVFREQKIAICAWEKSSAW